MDPKRLPAVDCSEYVFAMDGREPRVLVTQVGRYQNVPKESLTWPLCWNILSNKLIFFKRSAFVSAVSVQAKPRLGGKGSAMISNAAPHAPQSLCQRNLYASVYFRAELSASSQDYKGQIPKLYASIHFLLASKKYMIKKRK